MPQERNIFKSLTVHENLTAVALPGPWTPDKVYGMFPRLAERRTNLGNQLSGGEQQMLAVGRALVLNPKIVLLDEPLEGLAPIIVEELLAALTRLIRDEGIVRDPGGAEPAEDSRRHRPRGDPRTRRRRLSVRPAPRLQADRSVLETYLGVTDQGPRRGRQVH